MGREGESAIRCSGTGITETFCDGDCLDLVDDTLEHLLGNVGIEPQTRVHLVHPCGEGGLVVGTGFRPHVDPRDTGCEVLI